MVNKVYLKWIRGERFFISKYDFIGEERLSLSSSLSIRWISVLGIFLFEKQK